MMDEEMMNGRDLTELVSENERLREQLFFARADIPEEYCEDLAVLARARMGDDKSFEEAAREVADKYRSRMRISAGVAMEPVRDDDSDIRRAFGLI
ncbi:MAG: hypothetical protein IKR73_06555 [Oscillospiraceae bacterium]|nr:hypothetical protein [Oscillospiraceae bacterium]